MFNRRVSLTSTIGVAALFAALSANVAFALRSEAAMRPGNDGFGRIRHRSAPGQGRRRSTARLGWTCDPARIPLYLHAHRRRREGNAIVRAEIARREKASGRIAV